MVMLSGKQILALREFLQLSRTELAAKLGVSEGAVCRWELGRTHPRWEAMETLNIMIGEAETKGFKLPKEKQPA